MKLNVITRREFLKFTGKGLCALGLSQLLKGKELFAAESDLSKPACVWLETQDCAGCTESVLSCLTPDLRAVLLDTINLRFHETIMVGTGAQAVFALDEAIRAGGYILVVEGSIPAADARYAHTAGRSTEEIFVAAAKQAALILAVGACAAYGGIPAAGVTAGRGIAWFLEKYGIDKPYIHLPGCPVHPAWFFDTVVDFLNQTPIALDAFRRPLKHFSEKVHKSCPRRWYFSRHKFLTDWNDPAQKNYCLLYKGCKGQQTSGDCPVILWNEQANFCMKNGAPCAGCTQPQFYDKFSPLYEKAPM